MNCTLLKSIFVLTVMTLISCGKQKKESTKMDFGEIHPSQTIEKTLTLNFNDEAKQDSIAFVEFAYELENGGTPLGVEFTVDGKKVKSNRLKFYAKDFEDKSNCEVKIGIHFPDSSKQQEYAYDFKLVNASQGLEEYITQGKDRLPVEVGENVGEVTAIYNDPIPLSIKLAIALSTVLIIVFGLYYILTRNNMPFGHKTFKAGMLTFPDGDANVTSVRLENLRSYNISSAFTGLEDGLLLEPYDKIYNGKKKRFARLKNNSTTLELKLINDDKEEMVGAAQELYNLDEIKIISSEIKNCIIRYTNNEINRTL